MQRDVKINALNKFIQINKCQRGLTGNMGDATTENVKIVHPEKINI